MPGNGIIFCCCKVYVQLTQAQGFHDVVETTLKSSHRVTFKGYPRSQGHIPVTIVIGTGPDRRSGCLDGWFSQKTEM